MGLKYSCIHMGLASFHSNTKQRVKGEKVQREREISGQCEETAPAQKCVMSFSMSSDRWRYMCWREADLKWSSTSLQDFFFSCSTCECDTHAHTQREDGETKSHSCVQLVQNGKHVPSSALGAAASSHATLTPSTLSNQKNKTNQNKKTKSFFSAFLHILFSGS